MSDRRRHLRNRLWRAEPSPPIYPTWFWLRQALALKTVAQALRHFAKTHSRLYAVTTTNPFRLAHPEFAQQINAAVEFYTALLKRFELSDDDVVHTIRIFRLLFTDLFKPSK